MSITLPIAVFGNGDLYQEVFNAIALAMSDKKSYSHLIHIALLLTGTWAIVRYSVQRNLMSLVAWLLSYYLAFYVVFIPKATVEILDQVNQGKAYAVDNVPLGLAIIASYTSSIGAGMTSLIEQTFSLPDDLKYQQTGMVMASQMVVASTQFKITNPNFSDSLQGFVQQCVFYDLLLNKYSINDLVSAKNIWSFVLNYASPARAFLFYPLDQDGNSGGLPQIVTCKDGAQSLNREWNNVLDQSATIYGFRLFPQAQNPKNQLLSYLPESYNFLTNISDEASSLMQQNMMANALQDGVMHMSTTTNAPAALEAYAFTKAQMQKRLTNETVGDMAAYWLPIMKNVLEIILYGSFVIIFLLLLFPFGGSIFKNYICSLLWLQLWAPLYAILNLFMSFYAQKASLGALGQGGQMGLSLYTQLGLTQVNSDVAGLAGYLSLSIPLLAAGVVKGMMSVFTQAAQYIAGVTQGAASSAAGEAVAGNLSMGNVNYSNHSSFNTTANHFDTNARVFGGMYTTQMSGGSTLSMTPSGSMVMNNQSGLSNMGVSANLAESIRAAYTRQADEAESAGLNQAKAYSEAASSGMRSLYELGGHQNTSLSSGQSWSLSTNAATSEAISNVQKLTQHFASAHNISFGEAASVLGDAYAGASAGVNTGNSLIGKATGVSIGASAGYKRDASNTDSVRKDNLYSEAQDYVRDTSFAQNVDMVQRAVHENSLRSSNDEGNRLIDNMGASFDQAQSARNEMQSSFQQAQSYREMASETQENAVNINSNASQVVFEQLSKQGITPSQMEQIMREDPERGQAMVNQAMQEYTHHLTSGWSHDLSDSNNAINKDYAENNEHVKGEGDIKEDYQQHQQSIQSKADKEGFNQPNFIDKNTQEKSQQSINSIENKIHSTSQTVEEKGSQLESKAKDEQNRVRSGTTAENLVNGIDTKDD